jgi:hypothetical protein
MRRYIVATTLLVGVSGHAYADVCDTKRPIVLQEMLDFGNQWQAFTQGHSHQSGDTKRELAAIVRTGHTFVDGFA